MGDVAAVDYERYHPAGGKNPGVSFDCLSRYLDAESLDADGLLDRYPDDDSDDHAKVGAAPLLRPNASGYDLAMPVSFGWSLCKAHHASCTVVAYKRESLVALRQERSWIEAKRPKGVACFGLIHVLIGYRWQAASGVSVMYLTHRQALEVHIHRLHPRHPLHHRHRSRTVRQMESLLAGWQS